jgi:uncharacterized membrane protein
MVGVVHNWPPQRTIGTTGALRHPKTYGAEVVGLRQVECRIRGARGCSRATMRLLSGPARGRRVSLRFGDAGGNVQFALGDRVLLYRNPPPPASVRSHVHVEPYAFADFQRGRPLLYLALVFAVIVVAAGRLQGLRALVGLTASLAVVVLFVVPAIADGRPPLQVAAVGGLGVMLLTIPLVHGVGAKSLAACLGTAAALLLTLGLADVFTRLAHLSGLTSDEAVYLQSTNHISVRGLLLAGMVIGSLGVLADTTVTQASTVMALRRANPTLGFRELVAHATSVGRDHVAATVNTLVLAYTGAALPILIVFSIGGTSFASAVNSEAVAETIVATLIGSIGLIAAVPTTTALASLLALRLPRAATAGRAGACSLAAAQSADFRWDGSAQCQDWCSWSVR